MYTVKIKHKLEGQIEKLPLIVQDTFAELVDDLREKGPIQSHWPNYSKLSKNSYHCHLKYRYVACWRNEKNTIIIEVYYVGSREKAPY